MNAPLLSLRTIHQRFGPVVALDGVSMEAFPGQIVGLLGPNGAGKSSLIDVALGLTAPTSGEALLCGVAPRAAIRVGRVGALLQSGELVPGLRVRRTVETVASTMRSHIGVEAALEAAGIADLAGRKVGTLSGGQRQRLRYALALLPDPDVLIVDEPTTGMDAQARHHLLAELQRQASRGRVIVMATHYLAEAQQVCDRIVVLSKGRVLIDGPTDQVRARVNRKTVVATVPTHWVREVGSDAQVVGASTSDGWVRIRAQVADGDGLAARILQAGGHDLEITQPSLEDTFVQLTEEDQ
ncbi:ABC transporter ATP-binding protein [Corynebacterium uberis]|uniref:ABC transporter ATP-binding protein n=1 Tax=Corynebacterium TaxID=1716 RepID=UPI001D09BC85|nr:MULTISPECIES: ABC transporter ATP-binding protein [Corynebacterium]MCZ9310139.1 ABC transporter ATP-binding protein [Corynebacterium sp. c6VSa_13]UDL73280.1 ABC transporter ATP-binding protein [Corynebacterium uberis]UDL75842.1 ABC transporter ATP-binding protein [Corynebacterium uberis]UDL78055.1 ABC transporter ATP-binding protein [Corynebacterium uberis]UDL80337.1 ABC transporter ATP-binding protein [Corynebacterium uberis]